ncbi:hypothetical protein [Haloarchaeobius sp. TZWWS8]|uniref:hypothetical protein n=1 Tax=Haloarchaeobius sp. TZWWS8 TaxID=3446121 RepID=UPI003EBDBA3D
MPTLSVPDETTVGDPLPVRLEDGPAMGPVSVRLTTTDDRGHKLQATARYSTTTDGDLDTTKANLVSGADLGGRMPLSWLRPEDEAAFPYCIFEETDAVTVHVSVVVDDEELTARTTRTLVDPAVETVRLDGATSADDGSGPVGDLFLPPGDGPHPAAVVCHDPLADRPSRFLEMLASAGVAVVSPMYRDGLDAAGGADTDAPSGAGTDAAGGADADGAAHQPPVPLSRVETTVDQLAARDDISTPLSLVGIGHGSEAAALVAAGADLVQTVAGYAATAYGLPALTGPSAGTAVWSHDGEPIPTLPVSVAEDLSPAVTDDPYPVELVQEALADATAAELEDVSLPWVGDTAGTAVLVSGGHDNTWPATAFAERIELWRRGDDLETVHVDHPDAGHGVLAPYRDERARQAVLGGSALGDAEAAIDGWPALLDALRRAD